MHQTTESSSPSAAKVDFGACRSATVTCISEIGWSSNSDLMQDIATAGGPAASQWHIPWRDDNARGSCSLLDIEGLDGSHRRFLVDSGWNRDYMRDRFAATGVDTLLRAGDIEAVFLTHEHMDHLFGLQAVLEVKPDITIYIPSTFSDDACRFIAGMDVPEAHAGNAVPHRGELIRLEPGQVHTLMPGLAAVGFDLPIMLGIEGEQSLYARVEGKGLVGITGCGHHTVDRIMAFARDHLADGTRFHGLYGGLHLATFGPLTPATEAVIRDMGKYQFERIACNHCTGLPAVKFMIDLGYPVVRGSGRDGSISDLYVGNGDCVKFG